MSSAIESGLVIESFDTLASRPVIWLWKFRLAMGKLAIFDGDPGLGKSLVTLDLCARVTRGLAFPDGSPPAGPGNVRLAANLYLAAWQAASPFFAIQS